jgi:hypothetical protein
MPKAFGEWVAVAAMFTPPRHQISFELEFR